MPERPTKDRRNKCKDKKKALDLAKELMAILQEDLVEYLDRPNYRDEVVEHCDIDPVLFDPTKKSELADALNEAFQGSSGICRESLINILKHRTEGAELMADMKRTLDLMDKFEKDYTKCLHKKR